MSEFKLDSAASNGDRVVGLDIARSIAIISVVITHFSRVWWRHLFLPFVLMGFYSVELFFVLSGFLIGGILFRQSKKNPAFAWEDIVHFWTRRWFRTLPNYYLFFGVSFASVLLHQVHRDQTWRYFFFLQNFYHYHIFMYGISWSLCVEEWAYLILPLLVYVFVRFGMSHKSAAKSTVGAMIIIPAIIQMVTSSGRIWEFDNRCIVVYRISAIGIGVLLAYLSIYLSRIGSAMAKVYSLDHYRYCHSRCYHVCV